MIPQQIEIGKKVYYYPDKGGDKREEAIIESECFSVCGTQCCFINIRGSVVAIENLEAR